MNPQPTSVPFVSMPAFRTQLHTAAAHLAQCESRTREAVEQILGSFHAPGSRGAASREMFDESVRHLRGLCQFARSASTFLVTFADTFAEERLPISTAEAMRQVIQAVATHLQTETETIYNRLAEMRLARTG